MPWASACVIDAVSSVCANEVLRTRRDGKHVCWGDRDEILRMATELGLPLVKTSVLHGSNIAQGACCVALCAPIFDAVSSASMMPLVG